MSEIAQVPISSQYPEIMQSQMKVCIKIWIPLFYHIPWQRQTPPFSTLQFSLNHRMAEVGRELWRSLGSISWLKQGTRAYYPGLCPGSFWIFEGDYTTSLSNLHQNSVTLTVKKFFFMFRQNLLVPVASCSVAEHHLEEYHSILLTFSLSNT